MLRNIFSYQYFIMLNSVLISHTLGKTPDYIQDLTGIQDYENFKHVGAFFSLGPALYTTELNADVQNQNNNEKQDDYDYAGYTKQLLREGPSGEYNKDYYENVEIPKNASESKYEKLDKATENVSISNVASNNLISQREIRDKNGVVNEFRTSVDPQRNSEQFRTKPYEDYPSHFEKNPNPPLGNFAKFSKSYPIKNNSQNKGQGRYRNRYNFKGNNYSGAFGVRQVRHNVGNIHYQANNYQRPRQTLDHGFYKSVIPNKNRNAQINTGDFRPKQYLENSFNGARSKSRQYGVFNPPRPGHGRHPYVHRQVLENDQIKHNYPTHIKDIIKEIDNNPLFIGGIGEMTYVREDGITNGETTSNIKDVKHSMLLEALRNMSKADLGETSMNSGKIGNQGHSVKSLHEIKPQSTIPHKNKHLTQSRGTALLQNIRAQNQDPNQILNSNYPNQNNLKLNSNQNPYTQAKNQTESQNQNHTLRNADLNTQYSLKQNPELYSEAPVSKNPLFKNLNTSVHNIFVIPQNSETQNHYQNSRNSSSNLQEQNQSLLLHNTESQNENISFQNVRSSFQYLSKQSFDPNQASIVQNPLAQIQNPSPQNDYANPQNVEVQNQNIDTKSLPSNPQHASKQKSNTDSQASFPKNLEEPNKNLTLHNQSIPANDSQFHDQIINSQNFSSNSQYPSEQRPYPNQQSVNPQNQSVNAQNYVVQNQNHTSKNLPSNHQNPEVQDQNLNLQNRTPVQEPPEFQNQTSHLQEKQSEGNTTKSDPSIVDYNAYDDIPGWFDGEFPALTEKTTIKFTANATNTSDLAAINATGENFTSTTVSEWSALRPDVISDVKKAMVTNRMGYFTGFFYELLNILKSQSGDDFSFIISIKDVVSKLEAEGKLNDLGHPALPALHNAVTILVGLGPVEVRQQLESGALMIRERRQVLSQDILSLVNIMDTSYTFVEGETLLKTLDDVFDYINPSYANKSLSAFNVAENVVNSLLQPYYRMQGSPVLSRLIQKLNSIIVSKYKFDARFRITDDLKLIDKKHRSHFTDKNRIFNEKSDTFDIYDTDGEITSIYQKESTNNGSKNNKFNKSFVNNDNFHREKTGKKANTAWMNKNKNYKNDKNNSRKIRIFNDTLIFDGITQDSSNKIDVLSDSYEIYEPTKGANKYRYGMMLTTEMFNKQNKLPIDEERDEHYTDSPVKSASVFSFINKKSFKPKVKGDLSLVQKQTKINKDNNRNRIKTARKLETQRSKYDRLKLNEYNYEKALRHKQWNHKSYEVVTFKVDKEIDIKTKPISGKITKKEVSNIKSNKTEQNSNVITNYENFSETSENEDEIFEKEVMNNKINYTAMQEIDQHKDKYRRHLTSFKDNVIKTKENELIKGDVRTVLEESSYSDNENQLKVILSDAIRHSDFVINNYRKYLKNRDINKRIEVIAERSSYSDEEGIFKNNIYRAFGYNPDLELK